MSAFPEYFLQNSFVDFTISGEAEVSIDPLLKFLQTPDLSPELVPNMRWKKDGKILASPIQKLTRPDEIETVIVKTKESPAGESFSVYLSRGCPMKCRFCSNWLCHGKEFRRPDFKKVKEAIEQAGLQSSSRPTVRINFEDDNLLLDFDFWLKCIREFKTCFPQALFYAENGIDYRMLNASRCKDLINMGMAQFNFSLGSIDNRVLEDSERTGNTSHFDQIISIAARAAIPVITYFICGFKNDTRESVIENLLFLLKRETLVGISLFYAVPGIYDFEDKSIFEQTSPSLCAGSSAFPWNKSLSTQTLLTAFRLARFVNLLKWKQKNSAEQELISLVINCKKLYTFIKSGSDLKIIEVPNQDYELVKMFVEKIQ